MPTVARRPAVLLGLALTLPWPHRRLQRYLTRGAVERAVRPLLAMEEFTAGG